MITATPHPPDCRSPPMGAGVLGVAIPLSMAAHALVFAAVLLMAVSLGGPGDPPAAVMVDFVTVAPVEAPEEPAAAPDPEPPPPAPAEPVPVSTPHKPPKPLSDRRHTPPARMVSAAPVSERPSPPPPASVTAPVANAIRDYGAAVWARISRHKPRGLSLRGVVTVTFALSAEGSLESATVSHASGTPALDQASLEAVRASAPFPQPPAGATTSQLVFTITFEYQ